VRTGSGRKLPKIPDRSKTQTLPANASLKAGEMMEEEDMLASAADKVTFLRISTKTFLVKSFWNFGQALTTNIHP
jgi:hypothetical protein